MKKNIFISMATVLLACQTVSAQTSEDSSSFDLQGTLMGIAFLWMIGHMIYELFVRKNSLAIISIDEMKAQRRQEGKQEEMSEAEEQECSRIHDENFAKWTPIPDDPEERRTVTSKSMVDEAIAAVQQMIELKPTNQDLVNVINEKIVVLNESRKRQFTGSIVILVLLALFTCFMFYMVGWRAMPFCIISGVVYYMASLTPNFMIYNKELKGKNGAGALGWVLGLLASMVLGAKTIRTTTYWSDGTKTVDDDYTQHQVAWFISLFVTLLLVIFLIFWAAVNYLRNYVLYR